MGLVFAAAIAAITNLFPITCPFTSPFKWATADGTNSRLMSILGTRDSDHVVTVRLQSRINFTICYEKILGKNPLLLRLATPKDEEQNDRGGDKKNDKEKCL